AVEEITRQCRLVRARPGAHSLDKRRKIAAEQQPVAAGMIIGEARADEIAVQQDAPRLRVEQRQRETAVEVIDGERTLFEVVGADRFRDPFYVERVGRADRPRVTA